MSFYPHKHKQVLDFCIVPYLKIYMDILSMYHGQSRTVRKLFCQSKNV